jgi:type VI secretion system protein ImpF
MARDLTGSLLQASLLDRLILSGPKDRPVSGPRRAISARKLRECVLRDLTWLLNTTNLSGLVDLESLPEVARSVLNYGMPALTGSMRSAIERDSVAQQIQACIAMFEPRLSRVRVTPESGATEEGVFTLAFRIEAELWGDPVPQHLTMRTQIDVGTGDCMLEDRGG